MPRRIVRSLAGALSLVLLAGTLTASPPPGADPDVATADGSVIDIPRAGVPTQDSGPTRGTGLAQYRPGAPRWPHAGSGTVDVPSAGLARVGSSAISVTAPGRGARKPAKVRVTAYGPDDAAKLGGHGTAFGVEGGTDDEKVGVRVDVGGFAGSFGGDFESRLVLLAKPDCVLDGEKCGPTRQVRSHVDLPHHRLVADVPADGRSVFVVAAAPGGETGSYTATKLASSSKWSVGLQAGDFSWSIPMPKVPAIAGDAPDLDLGYSSQAVDGLTASENAQPSWTGLGWDLATPYLERRYNGCVDDGGDTGDLCWAGDELMLSLQGTSSELVADKAAGGDVWRAKQDPGWRIERHTGADNGDNNGEYWEVATPQGVRYTFGRGAQPTTGTKTGSVFTVPVFGDDSGEPCHDSDIEKAFCDQAWRWNLDGVVDAHGNSATYFYTQEKNRYARNGDKDKSTDYVRGGHVRDITYSQRAGAEDQLAPARLHFTTGPRCTEAADGSGTCPPLDADHGSSYPDVPVDQLCTGECGEDEQKSPSFFTGDLLRSVTAQRSEGSGDGDGYTDVDRMDFTYSFPKPSDGTSASLWLEKVQQTGFAGSGQATLPSVDFTGEERANRVDAAPSSGVPALKKLRITSATDELGRKVSVTYGQPSPCTIDNFPEGHADTNTQDCYPAWRGNGDSAGFGWWSKYLVTKVTVTDRAGGSPPQVTEYRYRGDPAWHYDDDDVTPSERKTWSDWRGYGSVDVAKMSDPDFRGEQAPRTLELTRNLFFRGMNGDRTAGGGTKSVSVTDSQGTTLPDEAWLRAKPRETQQFAVDGNGDATYELGGATHGYVSAHTTPVTPGESHPYDDAHQVVENAGVTRVTVLGEDGARSTRSTRLNTTFDTYGQATSVLDRADGDDPRCTKISYARDEATVDAWMLAFPYRTRTYAGTCDAPTALVAGKDSYFDGSATLGGPVAKGDITRSDDAVAASGVDTVSQAVTTRVGFDEYGRTVTETDGNGNTARTGYQPATGRPATVTETNALGQAEVTTLEPDRQQPVSVRDANGQVTTSAYDALGRLTSVRMPEQAPDAPPAKAFSYFLDPGHTKPPLVTSRQLQSGSTYVTSWSYLDSLGRDRQAQEISPASTDTAAKTIVTDTRYDDAGHLAAKSLPVVVAGGAGTALLTVPGDAVDETRHSYDALGRDVRTAQFAGGRELWATTTEYFGDHVRTTPPTGGVVTTSWTDARERQVKKQEGTGSATVSTTYTYTPADQIESITDPAGHRSTFDYDLQKRVIAGTDADAGATRQRYDANGNVTATWDAKTLAAGGSAPTLSTDFDALNRPTTRWAGASGSGRKVGTFTYDSTSIPNGIGREATQTTIQGGRSYTKAVLGYDPRGRVTGRSWSFPAGLPGLLTPATYSVRYGYDAADHEVSVRYPDNVLGAPAETITTGYDALGNPTTLTGAQSYISATRYAADGKLAGRDYANPLFPLRRAYAYEPDTQRLSRMQTLVGDPLTGGEAAKQDDNYQWDPAGNITSITDRALPAPVATCFGYDGLNRLSHAWTTRRTDCSDSSSSTVHDGPAGMNQSFTYAPDGNITSDRSLGVPTSYRYDDPAHPHAATKVGAKSFSYDENGAMVTRPGLPLLPTKLAWNSQHQLESQTATLVTKTSFVYAPDGSRLAKIDPLGNTTLYLDREEITVAVGVLPVGTRFYTHAGTVVAERLPTGTIAWQFNDTQGSAQLAVPADTPGILDRAYYRPYGQIRDLALAPLTEHGWLGKIKDTSTGLNALGARYYDADTGRFISPDPANDLTSAQTANPYSYGANNPVTYMDPTGLWSLSGAWNAVKSAASSTVNWVDEHKGLIANVAVGIGVGIAAGAFCGATAGVGCVIVAGAVAGAAGAAAGYGVDVAEGKQQFSWAGLATNVGIGAAFGALGAGVGVGIGAVASKVASSATGQAIKSAVTTAGKSVANTVKAAAGKVAPAVGKVAKAAKSVAQKVVGKSVRPATKQPMGGGGVILRDAEGASPAEIAASTGGPTGGSRAGQDAVRQALLDEADDAGGLYRCWRCGQTTRNPDNMHVGHRNVPTSKGGNLDSPNVCLEGAACNLSSGNRGGPSPGMSCAERGSCGAPYGRSD